MTKLARSVEAGTRLVISAAAVAGPESCGQFLEDADISP